jgi:hypothetical protein
VGLRTWWRKRRDGDGAGEEDATVATARHAHEATDSLRVASDRETIVLSSPRPRVRAGDVLPPGATEATRAAGPAHLQPTRVEAALPGTGAKRVVGVLVAVEGEFEGGAWALREGTNRVGREHTCEVCLPSEQLAPRHANIESREGGFQLQQLGEAELLVNDRPSGGGPLRDGDYVRIGMTTLRFRSIVQP